MGGVFYRTIFAAAALVWLPLAMRADDAQVTAGERPDSQLYGGVTLGQWRKRLVDFDAASPQAAAAVTPLLEILSDGQVDDVTRRNASLALGNIGEPARGAAPQLARMMSAGEEDRAAEALWAAKALSLMGPAARDVTPAIVAAAGDKTRPLALRQLGLEALARIGGAHPDAVGALIAMVNVDEADAGGAAQRLQLRALAVEAVGVAGRDAAVAGPLLARIVRNPREPELLRRHAAASLGKLGQQSAIAAGPLTESLVFDESDAVRDAAAASLAALGRPGAALLIRFLNHDDAGVRSRAAEALGGVKNADPTIAAALVKALDDPDERVSLSACGALAKLKADARAFLPTVIKLLESQHRNVRVGALELLASQGDNASAALPELERLLASGRAEVRRIAALAIQRIRQPPQAP